MSQLGAAAKRAATTLQAQPAVKPEPRWRGMVLLPGEGGTRWARVSLPESVMRQYLVGIVEPANMRGIVAAKIETELSGDQFIEGRGWPK